MTTREVVESLRIRGHEIKYRVRKDGGILITQIDNVKYSGASGNKFARTLAGPEAELSQARKTQLKIIKPQKGKKAAEVLTPELKQEIKRVQKVYNKNKVPISQGRITQRLIRKIIKEEGYEAAIKKLQQSERYATGYATSKTISALAEYIRQIAIFWENDDLDELANDIESFDGYIKDEDIQPAYNRLYDLNHGADVKDVVKDVRRILKIK